MGKDDLWDDSVLINAFNDAISKYKVMHSKGAKLSSKEENLVALDDGSNELKSNGDTDDNDKVASDTTTEIGDASNLLSSVKEMSSLEAVPPENSAGQPNEQSTQDKATESINSQSLEDYNELLNKYYELEDQRQKVLQKLNQFGDWSYQNSGSTSQEHQAYAAQALYPTESSFYCPYGCQSWASPCNASPCCVGGNQDDKPCDASLQSLQNKDSSLRNTNLVCIAMESAQKALSTLKQASNTASPNSFAKEGKQIEMNPVTAEKTTGLETDLTEVLNAWYSAGFYTGKYLSEQSKKKHG